MPGAGAAGGAYSLNFNVLQGDVDKSKAVLANDFSAVKSRFFKSTASPVTDFIEFLRIGKDRDHSLSRAGIMC